MRTLLLVALVTVIGCGDGAAPDADYAHWRPLLVAELNRRLLPLLLVTDADLRPFIIAHQWQAGCAGKGALGKFRRGAHIHHGGVSQE